MRPILASALLCGMVWHVPWTESKHASIHSAIQAKTGEPDLHDVEGCDVGAAQLELLLQELCLFALQQAFVADDCQQRGLCPLKPPS